MGKDNSINRIMLKLWGFMNKSRVCQVKCVNFLCFYGGRVIRPPFSYKNQLNGNSSASSGTISDARFI